MSSAFTPFHPHSPARRVSGSHSLSAGLARMSPPAGGWRACPCGEQWSSMRTRRRQPHSTSAPASSGTWQPCRATHGTPSPQTAAAAWRWVRWSSPAEMDKNSQLKTVKYIITAMRWSLPTPPEFIIHDEISLTYLDLMQLRSAFTFQTCCTVWAFSAGSDTKASFIWHHCHIK